MDELGGQSSLRYRFSGCDTDGLGKTDGVDRLDPSVSEWYKRGVKTRSQFVCQQCGYAQSQWAGKCPNCDTWNSLVETVVSTEKIQDSRFKAQGKTYKLSEIKIDETKRVKTGDAELDSVLGGGLVAGMVVLVAGEPGIGKSTLLTQVGVGKALYVCGEESAGQVALRVKRLGLKGEMALLESTDVDEIIARLDKQELVIIDSI